MRRRLVLALLTLVALTLTGGSATQAGERGPIRYVALGDSYSAASGVLPPDPQAPPQCLRSTRNYPHVIAARIDSALTDVSCGAAETNDFFEPQYDGVAPQLDALSRRTQLVTMTIGGNDNGVFIDAILSCGSAGTASLGQGNPCEEQYGNSFRRKIRRKTFPALVRALRAVHRKAPRARVAILGYPRIMPAKEGCFPTMPVAEGDVPYLNSIQATLNNAVRRAANRTDTRHVSFERSSRGHDACKPIGTRWIEPVAPTTNPVIVHPNALGERRMAGRTIRVLGLR